MKCLRVNYIKTSKVYYKTASQKKKKKKKKVYYKARHVLLDFHCAPNYQNN